MENLQNNLYEDFANLFVDYISLTKSEQKLINYYEFKNHIINDTDFNKKLHKYLSQNNISPLKTVILKQLDILSIYIEPKTIKEYKIKLKQINNIDELSELISMIFYSFYCNMDQLTNTFNKVWKIFNDINSKITKSHKKMIHTVNENISFMKNDSTTDSDILKDIKSIADAVSIDFDLDDLRNNILNKVDNIIHIVEDNMETKTKTIDNYKKVFEGLKLDLSIYEKQTKVMEYEIQKAKKEAITDEITGLYTKKMLLHRLEEEFEKFKRTGEKYSILLFSIKNIDDIILTGGDYIMEYVVIHITKIIKECIRKIDIPFKYSENEFLLLLPQTNIEKMSVVANRINNMVKNTNFTYRDKQINVHLATGGTELDPEKSLMDTVGKASNNLVLATEATNYTIIIN